MCIRDRYNLGDASELKTGVVYGPVKSEYDQRVVYIDDIKTVPRLRPTTRVNMDWKYAMSFAEEDLQAQMQSGVLDKKLDELWGKYPVLLDGKPLEKPLSYPICPE